MARIRVWLRSVECRDTEDTLGGDEFYLIGFISDGKTTKGVVTKPVDVNDNETAGLKMDGRSLVFDADIPDDRTLKIGFAAFDKDSSGDWADYGDIAMNLAKLAGGALELSGNPFAMAAGAVLPFVVAGVGEIMHLDKDDNLGSHAADYPISALENGREERQFWTFNGKQVAWWAEWDYVVTYSIGKGKVPRDRL